MIDINLGSNSFDEMQKFIDFAVSIAEPPPKAITLSIEKLLFLK